MKKRTQARGLSGPNRRLAALAAAATVVLASPSAAQTSETTEEGCAQSKSWKSNSRDLLLNYAAPGGSMNDLPICEPIALLADGSHYVHLDLKCSGCGDMANRFIEMFTNIKYRFVARDGGLLTTLANDQASMRVSIEQQAVMFHPPESIPLNAVRTYHVDVYASSLDVDEAPPKPPDFQLQGTFTITVMRKEQVQTITLASGKQVERTRELNDITVQAQGDQYSEDPGIEYPATQCWPNWTWRVGAPISGTRWMGSQSAPLSSLNERDIVTLTADGLDVDELELRCEQLDECAPSKTTINLPDTLRYTWNATAGTFLGGQQGRSVVYKAPDTPGTQVQITVTIRDTGAQFGDAPKMLEPITFTVGENRKVLDAALLSTIHAPHTAPPAPTARPPMGSTAWTPMPEAYKGNWTRFNTSRGMWELGGKVPIFGIHTHIMDIHPWHKATQDVQMSANPAPPFSFASLNGIDAWMKLKQYRHVHAVHCVAVVRRDVIHEILIFDPLNPANNMKVIIDVGWTPTAQTTPAAQGAALFLLGRWMKDFEPGIFQPAKRKVRIRNEFRVQANVNLEDTFRVGNAMNGLQRMLTNRLVPWQPAELRTVIPADRAIAPGDASAIGNFPTHWPYIDAGAGMRQGAPTTPIPYINFLDRDPKIDPKGI